MKIEQLIVYATLITPTVALSLTTLTPVSVMNDLVILCEVGIYTTSSLYGSMGGLVVGASDGLLVDLISGYPQWAIFSLVIHGLQGYVAGPSSESFAYTWLFGLFLGSLVMIVGYDIADWILRDWPAGMASIPGSTFQNLIGTGLAFPITVGLQRIQAREQY